ncbi:MAG TPA: YIP1 family protein [Chloroflexota bacterium]|jgi:hypothetical protein
MDWTLLFARMQRAARLDPTLYDEVEHDESALSQAVLVVVIAAVASALASLPDSAERGSRHLGIIPEVVSMLINWGVWSYLTFVLGTRFFGGRATPGELFRSLGFAMSPGALSILGFIPCLGGLVRAAVLVWVLLAGVLAVREALDCDNAAALGTVIASGVAMLVVFFVQLALSGALGLTVRLL